MSPDESKLDREEAQKRAAEKVEPTKKKKEVKDDSIL